MGIGEGQCRRTALAVSLLSPLIPLSGHADTAIEWNGASPSPGITIDNSGTIMSGNRGIDTDGDETERSITLTGAIVNVSDKAIIRGMDNGILIDDGSSGGAYDQCGGSGSKPRVSASTSLGWSPLSELMTSGACWRSARQASRTSPALSVMTRSARCWRRWKSTSG